ncbi:hypothetical protein [Pseudomonas jilinensis]|uniref:Uncharacterized protein n=1 Tax=Pseudomonas jilinensis TaxID=2078689 RepID=A0A396RZ30_9PSED|nr:hypothetical protein [Pseudomonas jilinensis]RHW21910.1 hypothetical protein C2846_05460 [Pseudomonas jilinensis]
MSAEVVMFESPALRRYRAWFLEEYAIREGDFWVDQIDMARHLAYQQTAEFQRLNALHIASGYSVDDAIRINKEKQHA